jgi:phthalate 4,5-dioxygenase reductase subunit
MTMIDGQDVLLVLRITRSEPAANGIQMFELRAIDGAELPPFTPGAHLSVRVPNGGLRNYSLCNDPAERDRYVIAVKRELNGRGGSISLIDGAKTGDDIAVGAPQNLFEIDLTAPGYIFVAGGIGVTPILSMIRHLRRAGGKPFALYYLTRSADGTAFLDELRGIVDAGCSVIIHHDQGDSANAYDLWPVFETPTKAHIYCCGPRPLMDAVRDMTGHWSPSAVHFEDFGVDLVRPRESDVPFTIKLAQSGACHEVPVGVTIMEVVRAHGIRVPSSCESGTCGTCKTRLISGEADHRDLVLTDEERADNIMICVSRGTDTVLELDL